MPSTVLRVGKGYSLSILKAQETAPILGECMCVSVAPSSSLSRAPAALPIMPCSITSFHTQGGQHSETLQFPLHPRLPGMVPALFTEEEKDNILTQIGQEALKFGMGPAKESVWQFFVNKSANNLHIVLGMSPVGETLRTRCRNFPGTFELGL